jgi:hypothetical protein
VSVGTIGAVSSAAVSETRTDAASVAEPRRPVIGSSPAAIATLLVTNAIPLIGVLFWGWSLFAILLLYWIENGAVGAINVLKIARAEGGEPAPRERAISFRGRAGRSIPRAATVPFFILHYGIFWVVHGGFVLTFFGLGALPGSSPPGGLSPQGLLVATVALAISHFVSYRTNYIGRGEYLRVAPSEQMMSVYGRVLVLHLTIIFGGVAIAALGTPAAAMAVMVVAKTAIDLGLHLREHSAAQATG